MKEVAEIPFGLAKIAKGRDILSLRDAALATNSAVQTVRKHLCNLGTFHGAKPIRIGGRIHFLVSDIATLIRGDEL
jgi:hypothetical protein